MHIERLMFGLQIKFGLFNSLFLFICWLEREVPTGLLFTRSVITPHLQANAENGAMPKDKILILELVELLLAAEIARIWSWLTI
jgi:hypothetical protein